MVATLRAKHESGQRATLAQVLKAQTLLANAELALIRAEKVAAVAKVDISDIETDPRKLERAKPSPRREVE